MFRFFRKSTADALESPISDLCKPCGGLLTLLPQVSTMDNLDLWLREIMQKAVHWRSLAQVQANLMVFQYLFCRGTHWRVHIGGSSGCFLAVV